MGEDQQLPEQPTTGQPISGVPAAPVLVPAGARPQGLSRQAIIWLSVGITAGVLLFVGMSVVLLLAVLRDQNAGPAAADTARSALSSDTATKTYKNGTISFAYPASLHEEPHDNDTIYTPGGAASDYKLFVADDASRPVVVEYMRFDGQAGTVDHSQRLAGIQQGLAAQKAASQSQLLSMRSAAGLGCVSDVAYTDAPSLVERSELIGMTYGYTCTTYGGAAITGNYIVWYDTHMAKHSITVTATDPYWQQHADQLQAIAGSAKVLS